MVRCRAMTSEKPALFWRPSSVGCRLLSLYAISWFLCVFLLTYSYSLSHRVTRVAGGWRRRGQRQTTSERYLTSTYQLSYDRYSSSGAMRTKVGIRLDVAYPHAVPNPGNSTYCIVLLVLANSPDAMQPRCINCSIEIYVAVLYTVDRLFLLELSSCHDVGLI